MVVVAIVGGTGSVGKTLVDAFKESGKHEVIVLARKVPEGDSDAPVFAVDYNNVEQLTKTLEANSVHTVISTIMMIDAAAGQAEGNMVAAAAKSSSTKRFIASNWGAATPDDESLRIPHNTFREETLASLRKTDLEWTQIHNGLFLDYYGMPHIKTYLSPLVFVVDTANRVAAIPGTTGNETISFTYTEDLGKFVVAALDLPKWDQALHCYSENATWNELIHVAEEITGSKFTITYDPVEKLQRAEITELPSQVDFYQYFPKPFMAFLLSKFGLWSALGLMHVPTKGSLNEQFPEIKTTTIKEVLGAWKGK